MGRLEIERALLNMGTDKIQNVFLSRTCLETLKALDADTVRPDRLMDLVMKKTSRAEMLRDKKMRNALIMGLGRASAARLAEALGLGTDDAYVAIAGMSFAKNSASERILFEFFGGGWTEYEAAAKQPDTEAAEAARPLFDHQIEAIERIKRVLGAAGSRVLLHMPTGAGKTRTAMRVVTDAFLEDSSALVVWLAYNEELCEQAIDEFKSSWRHAGNKAVPVRRFFGGHSPDVLADDSRAGLIVASLAKTYRASQRNTLFLTTLADRVSLVVIDEAHQAVAPTYKFILEYLVEKHGARLLGLSATPGRTWSDRTADKKLAEFFNRKKVTLDVGMHPVDFLVRRGFIAKADVEQIPYDGRLSDSDRARIEKSLDIPADILAKLAGDVGRNVIIADRVEQLLREGHGRIIIFATNIAHAKDMSMVLHARGHSAFYVDANTPKDVRNRIIGQYREDSDEPRIICNFGVLTTGFDAPKTTAVLIARPTKSLVLYSQMIGRAIRGPEVGGSRRCSIVTVTDISLPGFSSMVEAFSNWDDVWE